MIVGTGLRSGKDYTAEDKLNAFNESVKAIVKELKKLDEFKAGIDTSVKATIDYWLEEYLDVDDNKKEWVDEHKELFKIKIKEAHKEDRKTRNAFERELIMKEEAKGE